MTSSSSDSTIRNSLLQGEGIVDHDVEEDEKERDILSSMRGVDCLRKAVEASNSNNTSETSPLRVAISFTGGKDCHLALHRCLNTNGIKVVCLAIFSTPGREFSAHRMEWQQQQAAALDLPLEMCHLHLRDEHDLDYARAYAAAICKLREDYNIQYIVTGDVDLVGKSTTNFLQQEACRGKYDSGSVQVLLPLWQQPRLALLEEMLHNDFDIRFSCVKTPYFEASWIGRRLDHVAIAEMKTRNDQVQMQAKENGETTRPLDFTGENGEYHTMVVNGPMYRSCNHDHQQPAEPKNRRWLRIVNVAAKEISGRAGQAQGERWWVFDEAKTKLMILENTSSGDQEDNGC